jgi:flagellar hook-associated protein 3 FlgL
MHRVSQRDIYTNLVGYLNSATTRLMELNQQASSQKKVNKPSDNPVGMARILDYRDSLAALEQYQTNIDTAKGWLNLADQTLMETNTILTRARELAEQGATGTMTQQNRETIAYEIRELFEQFINLSNTEYEGQSIFAGHKTKTNAFEASLAMDVRNTTWDLDDDEFFQITGSTDRTIAVQFLENGSVTAGQADGDMDYRFSSDGGLTWSTTRTLAAGGTTLDLDGVTAELAGDATITGSGTDNTKMDTGTWLVIRPAAEYLGDDEDTSQVDAFVDSASDVGGSTAQGAFAKDVLVRIDAAGPPLEYSYSLDSGNTWTTDQETTTSPPRLLVPGGVLTLEATGGGAPTLAVGDQIAVRPNRAKMNVEISPGQSVQINNIGKELFGGIYQGRAVEEPNAFEALGRLAAAFETNDQDGIQQGLDDLKSVQQHLNTKLAGVGARENRLDIAGNVLSSLELNQTERLSTIEDVDVAELMTELMNQQTIYKAVLSSSSRIMKMNLVDYI